MNTKLKSVAGAYLSSRLLCSVFVYLGHYRHPYLEDIPGGWRGVENWWLNPWTTYDSKWFLDIAANGYQEHTTAFFPFYPTLLRLFGNDLISMAFGGVLISHVTLFLGLLLIFQITEEEYCTKTAQRTVWLMAFWPTAVFYGAVYTEALFIFLLAATFWALRRKNWALVAISGGLAAASRNPGLLIGAAVAIHPIFRSSSNSLYSLVCKSIAVLAPLLAFIGIQAWFWWAYGDPLSGIQSQEYFFRYWAWPWTPIIKDINVLFTPGHSFIFYLVTLVSITVTFMACSMFMLGWKRFPSSYLLLIGGITLMNLAYARYISPHTVTEIRYMGALFPFIQILTIKVYNETANAWFKRIFTVVILYLFLLFSYLFGIKMILV